jgi:hypothetical protein
MIFFFFPPRQATRQHPIYFFLLFDKGIRMSKETRSRKDRNRLTAKQESCCCYSPTVVWVVHLPLFSKLPTLFPLPPSPSPSWSAVQDAYVCVCVCVCMTFDADAARARVCVCRWERHYCFPCLLAGKVQQVISRVFGSIATVGVFWACLCFFSFGSGIKRLYSRASWGETQRERRENGNRRSVEGRDDRGPGSDSGDRSSWSPPPRLDGKFKFQKSNPSS